MAVNILLIFALCGLLHGASCLQFTTGPADGATVHACDGGDLALFWGVALNQGEILADVKWFHQGAGGSREMVAILAGGTFIPTASYTGRVTQTQNAGVVISQMAPDDAGNYTVEVIADDADGLLLTAERSASVQVVTDTLCQQARLAQLEAQTQALLGKVSSTQQALRDFSARHVSFHGKLTGISHKIGRLNTKNVLSNHGNGFDNSNGYFTAPYPGRYLLATTTSTSVRDKPLSLYIAVDDLVNGGSKYMCTVLADAYINNMCACHTVVTMETGQRAWLQGNGSFFSTTTTFSGFRLDRG